MKALLRLWSPWSGKQLARLREIERDFHVRAFGEELARVNLDLTIEQRLEYLAWMRRAARQHKVPSRAPRVSPIYLQQRCIIPFRFRGCTQTPSKPGLGLRIAC